MQSWLEGRNWVEKCAQATGMTASLRILSSKADSNTWERFTRSELKLESVHQESPRSDIFRKSATNPLLKQKHCQKHLTWAKEKKNWTVAQWSKVLFSEESKFCISFGSQGPGVWMKRGEAQNPCCLKSSVKFPQSVMIWGVMSSAGVGPLCFLKSTVNAAIYQDILEQIMLPSVDKLYGDADFIFQQDLAPVHTAKVTKSWFNDHGVTNSPDLNPRESMGYCQEEDERNQTQQCRWPEGRYQSNLGFYYTRAVPQADYLHSLSEMSDKKYWPFSWYAIFLDVTVCMFTVYIYYVYTNTYTYSIYFENIYIYIIYIILIYLYSYI